MPRKYKIWNLAFFGFDAGVSGRGVYPVDTCPLSVTKFMCPPPVDVDYQAGP